MVQKFKKRFDSIVEQCDFGVHVFTFASQPVSPISIVVTN